MITAEHLDALLEIWARGAMGEGSIYRGLWYPRATPEHRYATRGGIASSGHATTTVGEAADAFEAMDALLARLRVYSELWYQVIVQRWCAPGPDELRARRLNLDPEKYKSALGSARRWLRSKFE
jgi:hypothetical protein